MPNTLVESGSFCAELAEVAASINLQTVADQIHDIEFNPWSFHYRIAKRLTDLAICVILLPIFLPVFSLIALAIRLSSQGPIFYKEKRIGQFGKPFTILKFRSMYTKDYMRNVMRYSESDAAEMKQRLDCKCVHDPRITPIGRYIRKLSLDEIPQLINVLRGDMSLIGPRPVVELELERYGGHVHCYMLMVPGISGLWQVSGRNDVSYDRRVGMDAEYFSNWSFWLDMQIMARTIPAVARCKGAY